MHLSVASLNVNSVNARLANLCDWLAEDKPDIVCLQELKCETAKVPRGALEDLGYNVCAVGQKSYNGVALLSRFPIEIVAEALPGDPDDVQARYIEGVVALPTGRAVRICGLYAPNGNPVSTEKFSYKLGWLARLKAHAAHLLTLEEDTIILGDYNIIPRVEQDCAAPEAWAHDALMTPEARMAYRRLLALGFTDAFMALDGRGSQYTFWDYQAGAWAKDNGVRIDHILVSPQSADRLMSIDIQRHVRGREKASDHCPIKATFAY